MIIPQAVHITGTDRVALNAFKNIVDGRTGTITVAEEGVTIEIRDRYGRLLWSAVADAGEDPSNRVWYTSVCPESETGMWKAFVDNLTKANAPLPIMPILC